MVLKILLEGESDVEERPSSKANVLRVDVVHETGILHGEGSVGGGAVVPPVVIETLGSPEVSKAISSGVLRTPCRDSLGSDRIAVKVFGDDLLGLDNRVLSEGDLLLEKRLVLSGDVETRSVDVLVEAIDLSGTEGGHVGGVSEISEESERALLGTLEEHRLGLGLDLGVRCHRVEGDGSLL